MNLVLFNIIVSTILTTIILVTQFVNYPLFKYVYQDFSTFHKKYVTRIGYIVAPIMVLELIITTAMLLQDFDDSLKKISALLVILIWLSTFFIQVPIHNQLSLSNKLNLNLLIYSNWIRVVCWILKLITSIILFA